MHKELLGFALRVEFQYNMYEQILKYEKSNSPSDGENQLLFTVGLRIHCADRKKT